MLYEFFEYPLTLLHDRANLASSARVAATTP